MDKRYMKELESIHANIIEQKAEGGMHKTWNILIALEYLVTALMERERNPQDAKMNKVLIHDDDGVPSEVHLIKKDFGRATHTVCGERLQAICCVHITNDRIPVTCVKCIDAILQ